MSESVRLNNFLYLLAEMEGALKLGGIEWTPAIAVRARERLIAVTSEVAAIAERLEAAPR
jgi:hypothetical protein